MTLLSILLPAPPLAAVESGFLLLVAPLILLMGIWAVITAARILYPEGPLPRDARARSVRQQRSGGATPVRLRQIVEEQRRSPAPVLPPRVSTLEGDTDARTEAITEALWARRN